jgi:hypothetical protein
MAKCHGLKPPLIHYAQRSAILGAWPSKSAIFPPSLAYT